MKLTYRDLEYKKSYNEILTGIVVVLENNLEKLDTANMINSPRAEIVDIALNDLKGLYIEMFNHCIKRSRIDNRSSRIYKDIAASMTLHKIEEFSIFRNIITI